MKLQILDLGLIDYWKAYKLQLKLVERRIRGEIPDTLILLEHPHVITLGKRLSSIDLEIDGVPVFKVERGGEATYHGPGQLVGYPIIDLNSLKLGVWEYVHKIEEVLIRVLKSFGINAGRREKAPGVWVNGERKIASIGLAIRHWVSYHGFALNVNTDLSYFKLITPCGFSPEIMTSMERELGHPINMEHVKERVVKEFVNVMGYSDSGRISAESIDAPLETARSTSLQGLDNWVSGG